MKRNSSKSSGTKKRSFGGIALGLALMGVFLCELLMISWCRVQYTRIGYQISEANSEQDRLMAVQNELQVELARLKSPERLTGIAETSLGLQMPTSRQRVTIE